MCGATYAKPIYSTVPSIATERLEEAESTLVSARLFLFSRLFSWELASGKDLLAVQLAEINVRQARECVK